jgi:ribosomal protein S18 acetylase RimI-like enzyme
MIDLRPIERDEGAAALAVLDAGFRELWGLDAEGICARYDPLEDLVDPAAHYAAHRGAFLVLVDEGRVIGTGGIAALGSETAELKRLGILKAYRGKGLGRRMVEGLLVFARWNGYRCVRLEVATPEVQEPAVRLYARLGFRTIDRYREGPCELSMERNL